MEEIFLCWMTLFLVSTSTLGTAFLVAPPFEKADRMKVPSNFAEAKDLALLLTEYAEVHEVYSMLVYALLVMYLKAFTFPGRETLTVFSGALFGLKRGVILNTVATAIGSGCNYAVAYFCLQPYLEQKYATQMRDFRRQVAARGDRLFWYILSLILMPFVPNPFITSASALAEVPVGTLMAATCIGVVPLIYIEVSAGVLLKDLKSGKVVTFEMAVLLFGLALLVAIPTYYLDDGSQDDSSQEDALERSTRRRRIRVPGLRIPRRHRQS